MDKDIFFGAPLLSFAELAELRRRNRCRLPELALLFTEALRLVPVEVRFAISSSSSSSSLLRFSDIRSGGLPVLDLGEGLVVDASFVWVAVDIA